MLNGAQQYLANAPWLAITAGAAITLAVTNFNSLVMDCATRWMLAVTYIDLGADISWPEIRNVHQQD